MHEDDNSSEFEVSESLLFWRAQFANINPLEPIDVNDTLTTPTIDKDAVRSLKSVLKQWEDSAKESEEISSQGVESYSHHTHPNPIITNGFKRTILPIAMAQPTIQIEPKTKRKRPLTFQRDESNSMSSAIIEQTKQYSISEHKVHSEYSSLSQIDGIDVSLCQLPDTLARLLRDETHPGTRFTSLEEITNFKYRLKYLNVNVAEMFLYIIRQIQEVEKKFNSSDNTSEPLVLIGTSPASSFSTDAAKIHDEKVAVDPYDPATTFNNTLTGVSREAKEAEVLEYSGLGRAMAANSVTNQRRLTGKAFHKVMEILAQLTKQKKITLASVLGITLLTTQPALTYSIKTMSGSSVTVKEPKFKVVASNSGTLMGIDEAIACVLIIPHPFNLLLYDTRISSPFATNRAETIAYTESVFMVSRLLEALGQQLFDTTAFTALSITSKLPKGKNHNLRKWQTVYPAGDAQPTPVDVMKLLAPARRLLQYTVLSTSYFRNLQQRGQMEVQPVSSSSTVGIFIEEDFIRMLSPQVIQQLLYVEQIANESSFDSLHAVRGNNNDLIEPAETTTSKQSHINADISAALNNFSCILPAPVQKTIDVSNTRDYLHIDDNDDYDGIGDDNHGFDGVPHQVVGNGSNTSSSCTSGASSSNKNIDHKFTSVHDSSRSIRRWTDDENEKLKNLVQTYRYNGICRWNLVAKKFPWQSEKQCYDQWLFITQNDSWSIQDDAALLKAYQTFGNESATKLVQLCQSGRTDPAILHRLHYRLSRVTVTTSTHQVQSTAAVATSVDGFHSELVALTDDNNKNSINSVTDKNNHIDSDSDNNCNTNANNSGMSDNNSGGMSFDCDNINKKDDDTPEVIFRHTRPNGQTNTQFKTDTIESVLNKGIKLPKLNLPFSSNTVNSATSFATSFDGGQKENITESSKNCSSQQNENKQTDLVTAFEREEEEEARGNEEIKTRSPVIKKQWTLAQLLQAADDSDADSVTGKNGTSDDDDDAMHVDDAIISSIINAYVSAGSGNTINNNNNNSSSSNKIVINNSNNCRSDTTVKTSTNCYGTSSKNKSSTDNATNNTTDRGSLKGSSINHRPCSISNVNSSSSSGSNSSSSNSNSNGNSANNNSSLVTKKIKLSVMAASNINNNNYSSSGSSRNSSSNSSSSSSNSTICTSPQCNYIIKAITTAKSAYPQSRLSPSCSTTPSSQQSSSQSSSPSFSSSSSSSSSSSPAVTTTQQHSFPSFSFSHYSHKLPDLSDRLKRDEMYHHTTRFTTLEEITNFKHRLRKASVLTRQLLFRLISIIPNSSSSSNQRNINNDVAKNNTNANHDGDEEIDYIDDESSLNMILNHDGIFPRLYSSACHVIFQQLIQMLTQQRSKIIEALATILGITMIKTQPWSTTEYKTSPISNNCNNCSGGYVTVHEPRFRSVMDAPTNLKGLSEAVAAFLIIPHPLNLLVYQQQPQPSSRNINSSINSSSGGSNGSATASTSSSSLNSSGNKRGMKRNLSPSPSSSASLRKVVSSDIAIKDVHALMMLPQPLLESPVLCATRLLEALGRHIADTQSFTAGSIHQQQQQKQRGNNKQPSSIQRSILTHNSLSSSFVWTVGEDDNDNNISGIELLTSWVQPARRLLKQVIGNSNSNTSSSCNKTRMNNSANSNINVTNATTYHSTTATAVDMVTQLSSESLLSLFRVEELQPEKFLSDLALLLVTTKTVNNNTTITSKSSIANHNTNSRRR